MATISWPKGTRPGTNIAADGSYRASDLLKVYPRGSVMRLVIEPKYDQLPYIIELRMAGFLVLCVVANESFYLDGRVLSYAELSRLVAERYGDWINFLQVGNEWDHVSPSSWTLDEAHLDALLWTFWNQRRSSGLAWILVLGGAVSGQPILLSAPDLEAVDAIAVHPYGQRPYPGWAPPRNQGWGFGVATELISRYAEAAPGKPILITEYGLPTQDFGNQVSADYHVEMAKALHSAGVVCYLSFCWSDGMVDGFGIVDRTGRLKTQGLELARAMQSLYGGSIGPQQPNPIGEIMAQFVLGFKSKAEELGRDVVGDPLADQDYLPLKNGDEIAFQFTTKGVLIYSKKANKVHFIAGK